MGRMRTCLLAFLAAAAIVTGGLVATGTPAFAATHYYFCFISTNTRHTYTLNVYTGACDGGASDGNGGADGHGGGTLQASLVVNDNQNGTFTFNTYDKLCDNVGGSTHWYNASGAQQVVNSGGCGTRAYRTVSTSDLWRSPPDWWGNWGGQNSPTVSYPA